MTKIQVAIFGLQGKPAFNQENFFQLGNAKAEKAIVTIDGKTHEFIHPSFISANLEKVTIGINTFKGRVAILAPPQGILAVSEDEVP